MNKVSKFFRLPSYEKSLLIRSWILLGIIKLGLELLPFLTLKNLLMKMGPMLAEGNGRFSEEKLAWAVGVSSKYLPKATCLVQALALHLLLQQAGHQSSLHIGVDNGIGGRLEAHAWVESQDRVLIGGSNISKYTPLLALE
jgi:Transglutaminase-like superfamily